MEKRQLESLKHVSVIMDGNGRWAKIRNKMPLFGHRAGAQPIRDCIEVALEQGIPNLSLFAFSSENWSRPKSEVDGLMELFERTLIKELPELEKHSVCLKILGEKKEFAPKLQDLMANAEEKTKNNDKLNLILALNYGGKWEITEVAKKLAHQVKNNILEPEDITAELFQKNLLLSELPDVDLCIRTSGEQRISNFFLWQMAYAEFYFTKTLWPDFNKTEFLKILQDFKKRQRNFGKR